MLKPCHRASLALATLATLSLACATNEPAPTPPPTPSGVSEPDLDGTRDRIQRMEDRRSDGKGDLQRLAVAGTTKLRVRAVRALGRLPFPDHGGAVTNALTRALKDPDAEVRAIAAFGLGMRADPASAAALVEAFGDTDPLVRAQIVEAGSRFTEPTVREEVMYSITDASPLVRAKAVTAPSRWSPDSSAAQVVDSALANLAMRAPGAQRKERLGLPDNIAFAVEPEDSEVIWRALFSLSRRKSERGRMAFLLWCRADNNVEARIFATRGLSSLPKADPDVLRSLQECLTDSDGRVVVEAAVGLGRFPDGSSIPPLERALQHSSPNVRASVAAALGAFGEQRRLARPILETCLADVSPNVKGAAIRSLARLYPSEAAADLEMRSLDNSPVIRKAVAESCSSLTAPAALPLLDKLTRDTDKAVAFAAAQGLRDFLNQGGRLRAHQLLASSDNGLRLGAVLALQDEPVPADLAPLAECFRSSEGDIAAEIRYEILETAAELRDDRAFEILKEGLRAERPYTRLLARKLIREGFPSSGEQSPAPLPLRGDVPPSFRGPNPRVEVRTTRGTLVFELYPDVAPMHVHNFLTLARGDSYDGLRFHRVVPDFVVQGGDYRGDGNGGQSWRKEPLRHEFNELEFVEGSLGMPRNDDPDSGGSQFFVTHRPTPHLDGRYTLFGQLLQGFDVLPSIEEGDRILEVRVRGE